jgi:hypothetical protein
MTASTQGLTGQGLAGAGLQPQHGAFSPGFPQSIGVEQYFGMAQPWIQQPFGTQQQFGTQQPYGITQQPFGVQQPYGTLTSCRSRLRFSSWPARSPGRSSR